MSTDSINVELQLLDMHIFEGKTYVLAGAVNTTQNPQMYYAMSKLKYCLCLIQSNKFLFTYFSLFSRRFI